MYIQSQTFFLDPNAVNNATTIFLTSVDLYFSAVPVQTSGSTGAINSSGAVSPGVTISLADTYADGSPNSLAGYPQSIVTLPYSAISADSTGASIATTFTFAQPIPLVTGKQYAINIQCGDNAYQLWYGRKGDYILGTSSTFGGFSGGHTGQLFDYGTSGNITPVQNTQLKYAIRCAQFTSNTATYEIVNDGFEFLMITGQKGSFLGGENVFPVLGNVSAQTVSLIANSSVITGTGTTFTSSVSNGGWIAMWANTTNIIARQVNSVTNNTVLTLTSPVPYTNASANFYYTPVGQVYTSQQVSNTLFLTNSSANSSLRFTNATSFTATLTSSSNQYTGVSSTSNLYVGQPISANISGVTTGTTITAIVNSTAINVSSSFTGSTGSATVLAQTPLCGELSCANAYVTGITAYPVSQFEPELGIYTPAGGTSTISYLFASSNGTTYIANTSNFNNAVNNLKTTIPNYNGFIMSRSYEVSQSPQYLYGANNKSAVIRVTLNQQSNSGNLYTGPYIFSEKLDLFTGTTAINNDNTNENTNYGNAQAKHITSKIAFDPTYSAQDLLVQAVAYVPSGTSLVAYAKLYNSKDSDSFPLKQWTQLYPASNTNTQISTPQQNNYVQISWGLPALPPSLYTANGTVQISSATVTGSNTNFGTEILVNDVVRIWNPLIPSVYAVALVQSIASNTSLTLNQAFSNTSVTQPGFQIDKISNPYQAFNDPQNYNLATYYNTTLNEFSTYDTLQIKIDLLSGNTNFYPRIASLTAVGISA